MSQATTLTDSKALADTKIIDALALITSKTQVLTSSTDLEQYGQDWTRFFPPKALAIVFPTTVAQVQAIVTLANELSFCLVPSGGRTGLSAGATAIQGEVVISMDKLNKIIEFNDVDRSIRCQAGVITEVIQALAEENGLYYPVNFASAGSSQIGGNIATNAGGIKVIKYGMTRDWVLGLKVVTGNGDLLELNQGLIKNATAYDLRHLFIGSEGTLGIIVEATLKLTRKPLNLNVMVLGVPEFDAMMDILNRFQSEIDLSAFEFFSDLAMNKVILHHNLQAPFATHAPYYALLEFEIVNKDAEDKIMQIFEYCMEQGWILDGVLSQTEQQAQSLWALRERISETITFDTPYKNDISVTLSRVPDFLKEVDKLIAKEYPDFEIIWFGHIGDGNLHLNILKPPALTKQQFMQQCDKVNQKVFDIVKQHHGSISAEHGIGLLKKPYLSVTRSETEIQLMKQMRLIFDPNAVLNPGKLWD